MMYCSNLTYFILTNSLNYLRPLIVCMSKEHVMTPVKCGQKLASKTSSSYLEDGRIVFRSTAFIQSGRQFSWNFCKRHSLGRKAIYVWWLKPLCSSLYHTMNIDAVAFEDYLDSDLCISLPYSLLQSKALQPVRVSWFLCKILRLCCWPVHST